MRSFLARLAWPVVPVVAFLGFIAWMRPPAPPDPRAATEDALSSWLLDRGWQEPQTEIEATPIPALNRHRGPRATPPVAGSETGRERPAGVAQEPLHVPGERPSSRETAATGHGRRISEEDAPST